MNAGYGKLYQASVRTGFPDDFAIDKQKYIDFIFRSEYNIYIKSQSCIDYFGRLC